METRQSFNGALCHVCDWCRPKDAPQEPKGAGQLWRGRYHDDAEGCTAGYMRDSPEIPEYSLNNSVIK